VNDGASLSSHVLDSVRGVPASGVPVRWERLDADTWQPVAEAVTDDDGRVTSWPGDEALGRGTHRLVFGTGDYFAGQDRETFYPEVVVVFAVADTDRHHHVPLLLGPYSYTTYRGS
jgi:5-hydroxyisourate hydrolase